MSDQITTTGTGSNATFEVYYGAENRQKRIEWVSGVCTVRKLYSALQTHFDELNQMDDGVPMSAQTPTEFTIGIIDAGDSDPWFIDRTTVEYLYGGAIQTASWTRDLPGDGTGNIGIVRVTCNNTNIVEGDIGLDITHADGDAGTLLDVKGTGAGSILWIRPDSNALANDWDSTSGTITCNTHTATQSAAAVTGESLWANIYSIGTIEAQTHIYVYQNGAYLTSYKGTSDWWDENNEPGDNEHIDVLVNVKEVDVESDAGYITVLARQYSKTYSYYIVDLSSGGRNPIPLQTGDDLNNETGLSQFTGSSGSGTFTEGNYIYWTNGGTYTWDTTTKKGVITDVGGTTTDPIITYYLIGEPILDFSNGNTVIQEYTGTGNGDGACTAGAPATFGPATTDSSFYDSGTVPNARHGETATGLSSNDGGSYDIDENGTPENYSIVIDCNQNPLTDVYQWSKWITRRGETSQNVETDAMNGEYYIGTDYRLTGTEDGEFTEGELVTGGTSGATGTVVYHNTDNNILVLRNSRLAFSNGENVTGGVSGFILSSITATAVTPIAASPFGTFAGGKFFCAPGVVLINYLTADLNNFQLLDDTGTVRVAPTKVNVTVNNTAAGDRVAVFRLTAQDGDIKKDTYTIHSSQGAAGSTSIIVDTTIGVDEPGKSTGGVLRIVDFDGNIEDRYRFLSWSSAAQSTFTLFDRSATADAGGSATSLVDADQNFTTAPIVKIGDIVRNTTESTYAYVTAVANGSLTTTNTGSDLPVTDWSSDAYEIGNTVRDYTTSDKVYVPFIDTYDTDGTSETVQIVYSATVYTRVRARNAGTILPFEQDSSIGTNGMTVSVIRTADTIYQ